MGARADVDNLLSNDLGVWLRNQTAFRLKAKEDAYDRWTYCAFGLAPLLSFLWFGPDWGFQFKAMLTAAAVGLAYRWGYAPIKKAKRRVKVGINDAVAKSLGLSYSHEIVPGEEWEYAKSFGLVPSFERESFEDRWHGTLAEHDFELYEAHLEVLRGTGKHRRWVTVFRGAIIRVSSHRAFHGVTLLQRAGAHNSFFGLGNKKDSVNLGGHRLQSVDMVSPEFEDSFDLWSNDPVEARWLAHPAYIEKLVAFEWASHSKNIRALFIDSSLVITIESGDMFESGALNPKEDREKIKACIDQFGTLADLAELLNAER